MILDSPIISGSLIQQAGQTAEIPRYTAVSSSFLAASASFDARIDSIESTTASFSPRINALESFTASANATYVNATGDSMSGDLTITGSLIVTDRITAQEFHTEYVSSSVILQSGSTKFGDTSDDRHSFTGSLQVSGNVLANNLNGIFSSSAQLTGSLGNYYIVSGTITQTTWDNIANKPGGIVSGSQQLTSSYDQRYVLSGSITQTTWDNIANKPGGIVSGSEQVTSSLDIRYRLVGAQVSYSDISNRPSLISSSAQFTSSTDPFTGSFSGSFAGNGSLLTGLAAGAKFHTQTTPASTWTFIHNLSTQYPNVTVYGSNNNIILPQTITATNADTLVLEFGTPVSGYATAGIGGTIQVNGRTIKQYFTSSLSWRFEHNIGDRFVSIQTYDGNYEKIIPQTITLTDATSSVITFPEAIDGYAVGTIGGDLPSISSSYAGYILQVSAGAPYTASWSPVAYVTASNAINALTASYLNPISQSLIPAVSGAYDLGSPSKPWRHIYVGSGSIYLVDNTGNVVKTLTGDSIVTNDNLSSLNAFTASNATINTFTSSTTARLNSIETISASNIARLNAVEIVSASNIARIGSIETFTSSTTARLNSIETISASNISRINALEIKSASVDTTNTTQNARLSALETTSASVDTLNTAQNTRLANLENKTGSLATTGSNTFIGDQIISGTLYIQNSLVVQGSSSLQNITASAVSIGTNTILLNTANPSIRYAGISAIDSGSAAGKSGSLYFDSTDNEWIFVHAGNTAVTSSTMITGPETYDSIGNETRLTTNKLTKATQGFHIVDSNVSDDGTTIKLLLNTEVTGSLKVTGTSTFNGNVSASVGLTIGSINSGNDAILKLATNASASPRSITYRAATAAISIDDTSGNALMTILNNGKIGVGVTNPYGTFEISSSAQNYSTAPAITFTDSSGDASSNRWIVGNIATTYGTFNIASAPTTTSTTWTPRLSILSDGKVGLGTAAPARPLSIYNGSVGLYNSSTGQTSTDGVTFELNGTTGYLWNYENDSLIFGTNNSEKIRITAGGSVGIGTTSPGSTLEVAGTITMTAAGGAVIWKNTSSSNKRWDFSNSGANFSLNETGVDNRVTFLAGGNVGIGTTGPGYKFQVKDSTSAWAGNFENTDATESVGVYLAHGGGYGIAIDSSENDTKYIFKAMAGTGGGAGRGSVPIIFAQHNGNVGMGTDSPSARLDLNGGSIRMGSYLNNASSHIGKQYSGNGNFYSSVQFLSTTDQDMIVFNTHYSGVIAGEAMRITGMGNVGIGTGTPSTKLHVNGTITESSALRYKEDVKTLTSGLDKIIQMRGVSYIKKDTQTKEIGVIAEEINEILPDIVSKNSDGEVESVSYGRITAVLIEAIKEQQKQIEELKSLIK